MPKIAHKLVAKTAYEIACEVYEVLASNSRFYKAYPNIEIFADRCWPEFIGDARKALVSMLRPDPMTEEFKFSKHVRDEIAEALILEGEAKASPPIDLNKLREAAGLEPIRPLPSL
jgi:hypothetical protein